MKRWALVLLLACAPLAAQAQVPLNSLSAAGAVSSTDTVAVCQQAGGCGASNSLSAATMSQVKTYIGAGGGSAAGSTGNPQYNAGSSAFGADAGVFYLPAPTGNATTDTTNLQAAVTAAQSAPGGAGTILVPCGTYKINSVSWTGASPSIIGTCAALNRSGGPPYVGSVLLHSSASGNMLADNNTALNQYGITLRNITLIGQGSLTDTCLYSQATNYGYVERSAFWACGTGVGLYDDNFDDSNWVITASIFNANLTGISCTGGVSSVGGCDNVFSDDYGGAAAGGTAILLDGTAAQTRIKGWHFDCGGRNAVNTSGTGVQITNSDFENCETAVQIPTAVTGNEGRGTVIADNNFSGSYTLITVSCTSSNSSTSLTSCTTNPITAGVTAGMLAYGGNITTPYVYGSGGAGSSTNGNTLAGNNSVASVTSSTVVLTQNTWASGGGSASFTFCAPQYSFPLALPSGGHVISHGNTFQQGCGTLNDGG